MEYSLHSGNRRVILQSPTGSGKTAMAVDLMRRIPKPVLFLAHSIEIVEQAAKTIRNSGQMAELLTADVRTDGDFASTLVENYDITVASQMTAWSRAVRAQHSFREYKTIIADECHRAVARTWTEIFDLWPDSTIVGLTATPERSDGRGMGNVFGDIIQSAGHSELIAGGHLVDAPLDKIWSWPVNLKGVRTSSQTNDWVMGGDRGAAKVINTSNRVGDCVSHWLKLASDRPTIIYAASVSHAYHLRDRFKAVGVNAEGIDGSTGRDERHRILDGLKSGAIQVVANFGVLTEGFDCPRVSCIVLERPTKHFGLYLQMLGRGLRPSPETGKKDLMILDHVGGVLMHGLPTQPIEWSLSMDGKAAKPTETKAGLPAIAPCPNCNSVLRRPPCSACGWMPKEQVPQGQFDTPSGDLVRMSDEIAAQVKQVRADPRRQEFFRLKAVCKRNGFKSGWAGVKYKEKHGEWPPADWELPDPARISAQEYFDACLHHADSKGFKRGWAAHQYKRVFGQWPPNPNSTTTTTTHKRGQL